MNAVNCLDSALVLLGHGSPRNLNSGTPVFVQAESVRRLGQFAQVHPAFWKQEPRVADVLAGVHCRRIFIVPMFISEGFFSEEVIPAELGFQKDATGTLIRTRTEGERALFYCRPVGSHGSMTAVLLDRAKEVMTRFPFPRAPRPAETSLFIAGHGTEQNDRSRENIDRQVEKIRKMSLFADVQAVFLDEDPRIEQTYALARTRCIVVVPFFMSEGMHVTEDIPVRLGEPERLVRDRLNRGQASWRNPTEKQGRLVWYAPSVGSDPCLVDVIVERVREFAAASS